MLCPYAQIFMKMFTSDSHAQGLLRLLGNLEMPLSVTGTVFLGHRNIAEASGNPCVCQLVFFTNICAWIFLATQAFIIVPTRTIYCCLRGSKQHIMHNNNDNKLHTRNCAHVHYQLFNCYSYSIISKLH